MSQDEALGWTVVAVAEGTVGIFIGVGIAGGPAVRAKISEIEEITSSNRANGITDIARADIGVTLAFQINDIARAAFFIAGDQAEKTAASHVGQGFEPGNFE